MQVYNKSNAGQTSYIMPTNQFEERLKAAMRGLQEHGSIIMQNNEQDAKIIEAIEKLLSEKVSVEYSDAVKITLTEQLSGGSVADNNAEKYPNSTKFWIA